MEASSSPLTTPPTSQSFFQGIKKATSQHQYRPARALPFELNQHVQTYFEEALFTQAFGFLTSIVTSGAASADPKKPSFVPSKTHLAIVSTLSVHPALTTRTNSREKWQQSISALRLLRLTNKISGPVNSDFYHAFSFKKFESRSSRNGGRRVCDEQDSSAVSEQPIKQPWADTDSIWARAEDFWQVVGWVLNCGCLDGTHAARWATWSPWLEVMLDILEDDWEIHFQKGASEESLIWKYVDLASGGHGRDRRILRAIFADGTARSLSEFKEVFRNELHGPKREADKLKKREVDVNVEQEIYGDYMADDDEESSGEDINAKIDAITSTEDHRSTRSRTPSSRRVTPRNSNSSLRSSYSNMSTDDPNFASHASYLGPPQSLAIRLRLLNLLSNLSGSIPEFFMELRELYTLFVEFIRPLPLPVFQQIISISMDGVISPDAHIMLCEMVLQRLLETAAPNTRQEAHLTQAKLVTDYLPWAAAKGDVVSNTRVSLLTETLMRRLIGLGKLTRTEQLEEALSNGVQKRFVKVAEGRRKKGKDGEGGEAWNWLVESGERMASLIKGLD